MSVRLYRWSAVCVLFAGVLNGPAYALEEAASAELYHAYYLEHRQRDHAVARAICERLIADPETPDAVRREASALASRCRDNLAARNPAALMPPDVAVYVQLRRPGELLCSLGEMLGLADRGLDEVLAARPDADAFLPFTLPASFAISPAITEWISAFGGLAVGLTEIRSDGPPSGVMVLHHGDTRVLRGLIETGFQFSPTARKIAGLPTFGFRDHVVGVLTPSLLIVGSSRALVEQTVARLEGRGSESLATRADLGDLMSRAAGATLFVFADAQRIVECFRSQFGDDEKACAQFATAEALLDLKNLKWGALSFGDQDRVLGVELQVRFAPDHRNLVYNLIRTPPMTRRSLSCVPPDAAAVFGWAINAPGDPIAPPAGVAGIPALTGLDLFRELFSNVEELSVFVVPGSGRVIEHGDRGRTTIADAGVVIKSVDLSRSAALWNQILAIPAMFGGQPPAEPRTYTLRGVEVREYDLPRVGPVYLAELDGCLVAASTRDAMRHSINAVNRGKSIVNDPVMGPALERAPADSSILLVVHGGRAVQTFAGLAPTEAGIPLNMAAAAMSDTVAWAGVGESPEQLTLRVGVSGLPNVNALVQKLAPMFQSGAPTAAVQQGAEDQYTRKQQASVTEE